jgi:hypothetical protein
MPSKDFRRWVLEAKPAKKHVQDNLLVRYPRFRIAVDIQILRERNSQWF